MQSRNWKPHLCKPRVVRHSERPQAESECHHCASLVSVPKTAALVIANKTLSRQKILWPTLPGFRLQASGFRDGLILDMLQREGPGPWKYHKAPLHMQNEPRPRHLYSNRLEVLFEAPGMFDVGCYSNQPHIDQIWECQPFLVLYGQSITYLIKTSVLLCFKPPIAGQMVMI